MTLVALLLALPGAHGAELFEGWAFYLGDPHFHSGASGDGGSTDIGACTTGDCAALADVQANAAAAGLDWVSLTDHVNGNDAASEGAFDTVWAAMLDAHDPDGGLVVVPGVELWFLRGEQLIGHKNLYWFGEDRDLRDVSWDDVTFNGTGMGLSDCEDLWEWVEDTDRVWGDLLLIAHHPGVTGDMVTDWTCHTQDRAPIFSPSVEIYSEHGSSMEAEPSYDPPDLGTEPLSTMDHVLDVDGWGLRLGFMGGTDAHDTRPGSTCDLDGVQTMQPYGGGLTVVVAPDSEPFDRATIHDALVARRSYASSGPLLPALVEVHSEGTPIGGMGDELAIPAEQSVDLEVKVPADLAHHVSSVRLVGTAWEQALDPSGDGAWSTHIAAGALPPWAYAELRIDGASWWGDGGCADGGDTQDELLWLSPTWFDEGEGDFDGDGVTWAEGDCDDGDPSVSPDLPEDCSSGVDDDCDGLVDGEDPDCEGVEDTGPEGTDPDDPQGCGCGAVPAAGGAWLLAVVALIGVRRRRS